MAERGRPRTRPKITDPGIVEALCERIAAGEAILRICEDISFPRSSEVYQGMLAYPNIRSAITRAREMQQEAIADELLEIADNAGTGPGEVEKAKLRIWTRQWVAAKLAPKKFGDKIQVEDTTPKASLTRDEIKAQLAASGLRASEIFDAITKRAEPVPIEIEETAQSDEAEELPE